MTPKGELLGVDGLIGGGVIIMGYSGAMGRRNKENYAGDISRIRK